jgi:peptidoglycan/xylan/chitin deacetylase (PgdA/CDA1 family)
MRRPNMNAKRVFLYLSKYLGLFEFSRLLHRPGLRILCYHGFAMNDEDSFRPKLFIHPRTFERRLRYLSSKNFPVLSLEEGLKKLRGGRLPAGATVVTIDDGFYSTLRCALPLLRSYSFPATVFVTTYYSVNEVPIFRLAIQYMFWKTSLREVNLAHSVLPFAGTISWRNQSEKDRSMWELIQLGETTLSEAERSELAKTIGTQLRVEYEPIVRQRMLSLLAPSEIRELVKAGLDVQLHTHRHRLPNDEGAIANEIAENRAVLEPIAGKRLEHLCYPSGIFSENMWEWLAAEGIRSAVTCDPGLNSTRTPNLGLRRFLDGENVHQIEFESEVCGFSDLLRSLRTLVWHPGPLTQTKDAPYPA